MVQAELCIFLVQTRGMHSVAVNIHLVDDRTTGELGDFGCAWAQV